jgi:hypothetical protein
MGSSSTDDSAQIGPQLEDHWRTMSKELQVPEPEYRPLLVPEYG